MSLLGDRQQLIEMHSMRTKKISILISESAQESEEFQHIWKSLLTQGHHIQLTRAITLPDLRKKPSDCVIVYEEDERALSLIEKWQPHYNGEMIVLLKQLNLYYEYQLFEAGASEVIFNGLSSVATHRLLKTLSSSSQRLVTPILRYKGVSLNPVTGELEFSGQQLQLSKKEKEIQALLMRSGGKAICKKFLFQTTRGYLFDGESRSIDLAISRLRRKLHNLTQDQVTIETIRGVGYQLL